MTPNEFIVDLIADPPLWLTDWRAKLAIIAIGIAVIVSTILWDRWAKKHPTSHADTTIDIALRYMLEETKWGRKRRKKNLSAAVKFMRQEARNGRLKIWGHQEIDRIYGQRFSQIEGGVGRDYWINMEFDPMVCWDYDRANPQTRPENPTDQTSLSIHTYAKLRVNRHQLEIVWPRKSLLHRISDWKKGI